MTIILIISCHQFKNKKEIIIFIFGIEVNTNLFKASLLVDKIENAITITILVLFKYFFFLKKAQLFTYCLLLYIAIV